MKPKGSIAASILLTWGSLFLFQCVFFSAIAVRYGFRLAVELGFLGTAVVYHLVMLWLLLQRKDQFQIEPEGISLERVNLANILTMTRLSSLPTIAFLIVLARERSILVILLVFVTIIFLTDMLDGALSRMTHQVTKIGKVMDSFSDYLVLGVISIAFLAYRLIPSWFFAAIVLRSLTMIVGMTALTHKRGYLRPETSLIGKASIFAVMVLYAFEILALLVATWRWTGLVVTILEYTVGVFLVVSIVDKLVYFSTQMKAASKK